MCRGRKLLESKAVVAGWRTDWEMGPGVHKEQKDSNTIDAVCRFLKGLFPDDGGGLVWLTGGSVRDSLLGRAIRDIDLVAVLPDDMLTARGFRYVEGITTTPVWFRNFPDYGNVEITLLEGSSALVADLQRRDFTVNAMAMTLDGELVDPLGGQADLQKMLLVPCNAEVFRHDPLRIFRAFRFETEGYCLSEKATALLRSRGWDEELQRFPVERFSREMLKALAAPLPEIFFQRMLEFDLGRNWLPELFSMHQVPAGPLQYHPEGDLLTHSFQVLARLAAVDSSPLARFCAFFHDIGKLATDPALYPKHHGHEESGFKAAPQFCRRLALPLEYGRALAWISRYHGNANRLDQLRTATRIRMAEQSLKAGISELLPRISAADKGVAGNGEEWQRAVAVAGMSCEELGIDREKLLALKPGKRGDMILQRRVELLRGRF